MKYFYLLVISLSLATPASAATFQSHAVGVQIGNASTALGQATDNLIYGVTANSAAGSLLLLQNPSGSNKFKVDFAGILQAGSVPWARLSSFPSACGAGEFVTAVGATLTCASAGATPTLQTVTTAGNTTTLGITVVTLDTGQGAYELYAMNQNVRTSDGPTFASSTIATTLTLQGSVFDATNAAALYLNAYGDAQIRIDANNNGANQFKINNGENATVLTVDESGNLAASGAITAGGMTLNGNLRLHNTEKEDSTCNAGIKGSILFDLSEDKPYVCTAAGWKPLDSDGDKDGITDAFDFDDNDPNDATATTADVATGKTFYANSSRLTGIASLSRPGCYPGDAPADSGDGLYDWCDNDHDGTTDELEPRNTTYFPSSHWPGILLEVAGQTCYRYSDGAVWGTNGNFFLYLGYEQATRFCQLRVGPAWSAVSYTSSGGDQHVPCFKGGDGVSWYHLSAITSVIKTITCNDTSDDIRN